MNNNKLIKKTVMYLIGNFSSKILSALLIPLYAFYVTTEDFGNFDFMQTLMSMLAPIIVLAIWESILKFSLSSQSSEHRTEVINNGLVFSILTIGLFLVTAPFLNSFFKFNIPYFSLFLAMVTTYILSQIMQYASRALQENKVFVISGILSTIINFIFIMILVVGRGLGIKGLLISYILGQLFICIYISYSIKIFSNFKFKELNLKLLNEMIKYSAPLVLNLISVWSLNGFGRFLINNNIGSGANGLYSFAFKFSLLITMFGSVVNMAFIEETILFVNNKNFIPHFEKQIMNITKLFMWICLLAIPVIAIFYSFIEETDYSATIIYTYPLILYSFYTILSTNIGTIFQATGQTRILFKTTLIGAVANVFISVSLITNFGIWSIIIGQLIGGLIVCLLRYIEAIRNYKIKVYFLKLVSMNITIVLIGFLSNYFKAVGNIFIFLILCIVFYTKNKTQINSIINKIVRR